jgi:hypothetical protein
MVINQMLKSTFSYVDEVIVIAISKLSISGFDLLCSTTTTTTIIIIIISCSVISTSIPEDVPLV